MAFQIVALTLDANDYVIERRVVPYPYPTRQEAVTVMVTARGLSSKVPERPSPPRGGLRIRRS